MDLLLALSAQYVSGYNEIYKLFKLRILFTHKQGIKKTYSYNCKCLLKLQDDPVGHTVNIECKLLK